LVEAVVRTAKQDPISGDFVKLSDAEFEQFLRTKPTFQELASRLLPQIMSGMLMFGADPNDNSTQIDDIEKLIKSSDHDTFEKARKIYQLITCGALQAIWSTIDTNASPDNRQQAINAVIASTRNCPEWAVNMLGPVFS
jgi:hypothetical protein